MRKLQAFEAWKVYGEISGHRDGSNLAKARICEKDGVFMGFEAGTEKFTFPQTWWNVHRIFLSCGQSPCIYYDYYVEKTVNSYSTGPQT